MKIYTRTGDDGTTSLYGGKRVRKDHIRLKAYGTIDELNSALGVLIAHLESNEVVVEFLIKIQKDLFNIGSYLAGSHVSLEQAGERVGQMERFIDRLDSQLPHLTNFILPTGAKSASLAHLVRAVTRRAERKIVSLLDDRQATDFTILCYLNRLSDLMFVIARFLNHQMGIKEVIWTTK